MSATGISATNLATHYPIDNNTSTSSHNNLRFHEDLGQLGEDLQEGNLTSAQQDFAALQVEGAESSSTISNPNAATSASGSSTTATESNNPITQAFDHLAVDLQTGNLSASQQDYANVQQDFQSPSQGPTSEPHFNHEHHIGGVNQLLDQLGQQLQSNNLSTAQQTYASLLQNAPFAQTSAQQLPGSNGVSISV
jgi:hypothetical protein